MDVIEMVNYQVLENAITKAFRQYGIRLSHNRGVWTVYQDGYSDGTRYSNVGDALDYALSLIKFQGVYSARLDDRGTGGILAQPTPHWTPHKPELKQKPTDTSYGTVGYDAPLWLYFLAISPLIAVIAGLILYAITQ